jgi:DNA-binding FadR family transcriptional regulator
MSPGNRASRPRSDLPVETNVFDALLDRILDGTYGPHSRLPPERALVEELGASRISVRGALARLASRQLIEIQRGSGTVVRPKRDWSFGALPLFARHCAHSGDVESLTGLVGEILALRRFLMIDAGCSTLHRSRPGDFDRAREVMLQAWNARHTIDVFLRLDLEKSRRLLEARGALSSLWLLNTAAEAYLDFAAALSSEVLVPADYVRFHQRLFEALEADDTASARKLSAGFLDRQDAATRRFLQAAAAPARSARVTR